MQAMDRLSVKNFADSVEQLYQNILESGDRPKRIAAPAIPLVIGVKAARGITRIPLKLARSSRKKAASLFSLPKEK